MAASSRRKLTLNTVSVKLGCGSCRTRTKPKLLLHFLFNRKPNNHHHNHNNPTYTKHHNNSTPSSSSSSSFYYYNYHDTTTTTTTTFSSCYDDTMKMNHHHHHHQKKKKKKKSNDATVKGFGSVAVEKDSEDPFLDFKNSMLQMIIENEIYNKEDLSQLLKCFLQLNSTHHHP
ncbi:hypothetical protein PIB30_036533, partial [Stylosanthes scabra]|nr:hypothetical protein [Stylosanthes scabra]